MKFSTINRIVEGILEETPGDKAKKEQANSAAIILKTALICEHVGIDNAMKYYFGTHSEDEYQEWQTGVTFDPAEVSLCPYCQCTTHTLAGNICGKCLKHKSFFEEGEWRGHNCDKTLQAIS